MCVLGLSKLNGPENNVSIRASTEIHRVVDMCIRTVIWCGSGRVGDHPRKKAEQWDVSESKKEEAESMEKQRECGG